MPDFSPKYHSPAEVAEATETLLKDAETRVLHTHAAVLSAEAAVRARRSDHRQATDFLHSLEKHYPRKNAGEEAP